MGERSTSRLSVTAGRYDAPAGGGAFQFDRLSIGVFLIAQPTHQIALGSDRRADRPMAANEGWILPPGASGLCAFEADHQFVSVEIDGELLRQAGHDPRRGVAPQFGAHDPLLLQMALTAATPPPGATLLYLETMRQALAAHVAHLIQPLTETEAAIDDVRLRRAVAYIHDHLAEDLSLETLAGEAAMSPFHFARAFKKATGKSPLQFVLAERLALAKVLLRTTALPVSDVAHRVGYADVSRFSKHFKRTFGATPGAARG